MQKIINDCITVVLNQLSLYQLSEVQISLLTCPGSIGASHA